jgi:hypothetical protein
MNERIRELVEKSYIYDKQNDSSFFNKQKFAELIVQECIETLRLVPYNSDREFGDEVIYQDAVKRYFGVEE